MVERLILIDASGYIFRAFYGIPPMSTSSGIPINAVFGFCMMLNNLLDQITPDTALGVVFDESVPTFRHVLYPAYKKNRKALPEELISQLPIVRESAIAFQVPILSYPGYEADDVIATYVARAQKMNLPVTIYSNDKDLLQLMDESVDLIDPLKNRLLTKEDSLKKFGVDPKQIVDVQALMGDSSDNIPGIKGIGPKTAAKLINRFGDFHQVLNHVDDIEQKTLRSKVKNGSHMAYLSYKLVQLDKNVPLNISIDDLACAQLRRDILIPFLKKYEFKKLLIRYQNKPILFNTDHICNVTTSNVNDLYEHVLDYGKFSFDSWPNIGVAIYSNRTFWVSHEHLSVLHPLLQDRSVRKIGWHIKQQDYVLLESFDDILLMSSLLNKNSRYDLLDVAESFLKIDLDSISRIRDFDSSKNLDYHSMKERLVIRSQILFFLFPLLRLALSQNNCFSVYELIDKPLIPILHKMEKKGLLIDCTILQTLKVEFQKKINEALAQINHMAGMSFNIASSKQLGEVLLNIFKLPIARRNKTGHYITDSESLKKINHPVIYHILQFRKYNKLLSTYVDPLLDSVLFTTNRIHTQFDMHTVHTGRLSSKNPNLQNIPIKTEDGKQIRRAFIAPEGFALISLDYRQMELHIMAYMARSLILQDALNQGIDIHVRTAQEIFGVQDVDADLRRRAKAVNFGIIYGMSPFGLSENLGISISESKMFINRYFSKFPEIASFMEQCKSCAHTYGYVETLFGRRIYIPGIHSSNSHTRSYAERQAINAPIQGTAADIIKYAMIRCDRWINQEFPNISMLLQVHDELIFESPEAQAEEFSCGAKYLMETIGEVNQQLRLDVDVGIAKNWFSC